MYENQRASPINEISAENAYRELRRRFVSGALDIREFERQTEALYSSGALREVPEPRVPEVRKGREVRRPRMGWPVAGLLVAIVVVFLFVAGGHFFFWPLWPLFWIWFLVARGGWGPRINRWEYKR